MFKQKQILQINVKEQYNHSSSGNQIFLKDIRNRVMSILKLVPVLVIFYCNLKVIGE